MKKKTRYFIAILTLFNLTNVLASASTQTLVNSELVDDDHILHTTVFHNRDHQTFEFQVTFGIGYGDENNCQVVKKRIFKSTHADGFEAHNYGRYLAKEFGPELFTCVYEQLHVIGSQFPDEN